MAKKALELDKNFSNLNYLKEKSWGDRLLADAQKLLDHLNI